MMLGQIAKWRLMRGKASSQPFPPVITGRLNFLLCFPFLAIAKVIQAFFDVQDVKKSKA